MNHIETIRDYVLNRKKHSAFCSCGECADHNAAISALDQIAQPTKCECPARTALERLRGAGDRKVLDGSVLFSAPFLDNVTAALSAPCPCEGKISVAKGPAHSPDGEGASKP